MSMKADWSGRLYKTPWLLDALAIASLACAPAAHRAADAGTQSGTGTQSDAGTRSDAGTQSDAGTSPPAATSVLAYDATFFVRALDVSCAPPDAQAGVAGCVALIRYQGELKGLAVPPSSSPYGSVAFVRTDAAGNVAWVKTLMSGFDPIDLENGSFVDDDTRVHLLANGEFLVSGTYEGRVFIGTQGGNNQALGPSQSRNLFMIEFHQDGTFDNWEDTGNGKELHALGVVELPSTNIVIVGSCQGDVPLDTGSFPCTVSTAGYVLTVRYDGSTVGALTFGGSSSIPGNAGVRVPYKAQASDVVADAAGNVYVSGTFEDQMKFGTEPEDVSAGEDDAFLTKLAPDGSRAWIVTAGGLGHDRGGRLARVDGGVLWTTRVSRGGRVGQAIFPVGGHVVARVDDTGRVIWTRLVPDARGVAPLGIAAASDGSFALYGDGILARYAADGTPTWGRTGVEVRGAAFTTSSLVVAATVFGTKAFDQPIASTGVDAMRGALVTFAR